MLALVGAPCRAVDAGCGTGRAAVLLAACGVTGVGVEPDRAMAEVARRNLAAFSSWRVDVADFEDWRADEPFDLVTSAQAWHWIDPERGTRTLEEILQPGGWLAIFRHDWEPEDTPVRRAIDAAYAQHDPSTSASTRTSSLDEPLAHGARFGHPIRREYVWSATYTSHEWIELIGTTSDHRVLPEAQRSSLLAAVATAIDAHGGIYVHRYVTRLWAAQRL